MTMHKGEGVKNYRGSMHTYQKKSDELDGNDNGDNGNCELLVHYSLDYPNRKLIPKLENHIYTLIHDWMDLEQLKELRKELDKKIKYWEKNGRHKI